MNISAASVPRNFTSESLDVQMIHIMRVILGDGDGDKSDGNDNDDDDDATANDDDDDDEEDEDDEDDDDESQRGGQIRGLLLEELLVWSSLLHVSSLASA